MNEPADASKRKSIAIEQPNDAAAVKTGPAGRSAGGMGALLSSITHIRKQSGVIRGVRALVALNQKGGFDCPGCAWPEPDQHRSAFEFCENGAKAVAWEVGNKKADAHFFASNSVQSLAAQSDHWLGQQGRLSEPMVLRPGASHYEPISWDRAFTLVGQELRALASPDQALFYTSGRTSNEAAFLYQLFVRAFGTNNLPDCSNMCHESSGAALRQTIGVGKGTVQLEDFDKADAIFIIGQNPGTNHPRMLTTLQQAAKRGAQIVSINPLPEAALINFQHPQNPWDLLGRKTAISTLFLQVKIGGDLALMKGILKHLLADEAATPGSVADRSFIEEHGHGFQAMVQAVSGHGWEELESQSGLSRQDMRKAADIAAKADKIIACWAMGLTQNEAAVATIREVVNLLLLRGCVGKPGAGVCPVRGHSNVQGDRTMGIWEKMPESFLTALEMRFGFFAPRQHGLDTVDAIQAMLDGRAAVFVGMGGNFLSATPDTRATAEALQRCRLTVQVSTKLNRGHLITGETALILPCLGRSEKDLRDGDGSSQFVTVEDSMGLVHATRGKLSPVSPHLKSEVQIVAGMAEATLTTSASGPTIAWQAMADNYDLIRDHIEAVIPGFESMNERARRPEGFALPNAARMRLWDTANGKANFTANALFMRNLEPDQLLLATVRSHDQFNTTVYGLDDRYRGIRGGRRVLMMNAHDIKARNLADGDMVDITSHHQGVKRMAEAFKVVCYPIALGCAAAYFPEANVLVPLHQVAQTSNTPASKSIVITVQKCAEVS